MIPRGLFIELRIYGQCKVFNQFLMNIFQKSRYNKQIIFINRGTGKDLLPPVCKLAGTGGRVAEADGGNRYGFFGGAY